MSGRTASSAIGECGFVNQPRGASSSIQPDWSVSATRFSSVVTAATSPSVGARSLGSRGPANSTSPFRIAQPVPLTTVRVVRTHLGALRAHGSACRDHRENRERLPLTAARVL